MKPNSQENANCSLEVNNPIALTSNPTTEAAKHMEENFLATPESKRSTDRFGDSVEWLITWRLIWPATPQTIQMLSLLDSFEGRARKRR